MDTSNKRFVVCIDNTDYRASLILKKIYEIVPDEMAARDELIRIVDESGEDYLYHKSHFVPVDLPAETERVLVGIHDARMPPSAREGEPS